MSVTTPGQPARAPEEGPAGAACAVHQDAPAAAVCERCGAFACADCMAFVAGKPYCGECRQRGDVDYTLALKEKFWGRRDGYVWFFGIVGTLGNLSALALGVALLGDQPLQGALTLLGSAYALAVFISYLLLLRWSRAGLFGIIVVNILVAGLSAAGGDPELAGFAAGTAIGQQVLPFIFFLSAYKSARNQLAFKIEVRREALEKMYRTYFDNQIARAGFALACFSLLVPGLELLAGILCVLGLRRVDPNSVPPIGRKKTAIAGLVFSALGLVSTIGFVLALAG